MKSFEGTVVSEVTMVNDSQSTHLPSPSVAPMMPVTSHPPRVPRHAQSHAPAASAASVPQVRRQMGSPKVLCKVFVGGIGWGSQVRLAIVLHIRSCRSHDVTGVCFLAADGRRDSRTVPRLHVAAHPVVADGRPVLRRQRTPAQVGRSALVIPTFFLIFVFLHGTVFSGLLRTTSYRRSCARSSS